MAYKIAGIDVHKKVLMVVVIDATTPDEKPERRRFAILPSDLRRLSTYDPQNPEHSMIEPGGVRNGKYLAAELGFLLLGVLVLLKNGQGH
jgi:hypothetical protein